MATVTKGTVLTCAHEGCNCRVLIEEECHCAEVDSGSGYRCACGAPLVPLDAPAPADLGAASG
jgi:hypothetical protein